MASFLGLSMVSQGPDEAGPTSNWRLRDMAHEIRPSRSAAPTNVHDMTSSSHFDIDTCLARIRRDKAPVVRNSFEAAASTVVESLTKSDDDVDIESVNEDELPSTLRDVAKLEGLRNVSLERAHDNKDAAKRKSFDSPAATKAGATKTKTSKKSDAAPKFTRNTPASSAAALDARLTSSRAILCTAANIAFDVLTPPLPGLAMDMTDVPQNPNNNGDESKSSVSNMGAVVVEAQTLGQRIEAVAKNAARRSARRYQYRKDNLRYDRSPTSVLHVKNPFAWKGEDEEGEDDGEPLREHTYDPEDDAVTDNWSTTCLPRFLSVLHTGVGHALYHDVQWTTRHGRIANLLQELANEDRNFGPHLIVTVEPDVDRFAQEFRAVNSHLRLMLDADLDYLRALKYAGTPEQRRRLRRQFPEATGLPEAPFHVIVTSYAHFLQDYLHFCQIPFEVTLLDDGASWMAAAQGDPNSPLGTVWDSAIWSKNDHQMGLAGTSSSDWDFTVDELGEDTIKDAWIGLTARHRILTSSTLQVHQRSGSDPLPVSGIVNFIAPHFADAVREEWDRSRITNDGASMKHFRKLLTRSMIVHDREDDESDVCALALRGLQGALPDSVRSDEPVPDLIADEVFVSDGKVAQSRRQALQWLGPVDESWLRYELGLVSLTHIIDAMKASSVHGHLCEEIVTASSTTASGATGQVTGTLAYRLAVRCSRHFGSEQGLRQHHSALHAPPGTWLCRTCGSDCITSQARTHHERTCGQPNAGGGADGENGSGAPSSGGGGASKANKQHGPAGVVGKKKGTKPVQSGVEEKDPDGSIRVAGYRGVWVNQAGKHFVKINGERHKDDGSVVFFASVDEAAKKHDEVLKATDPEGKLEYNFKSDGTRFVYEDVTTSSTTGLGGGAASVVPALSVINIKDLPADVKPLLRDPRQTSRTGGNSKRHVYAYRGVCRQARKGHDRWQSQISFMGVNHYLGTFDSEWDAAAIYAWAHLILYGDEATKQAQKEGEEAAAAYEKEKRDIAAGIIPAVPPKPEKKAKRKPGKKQSEGKEGDAGEGDEKAGEKKRKRAKDEAGGEKKKPKATGDKESIAPILSKSVGKAPVLSPRHQFIGLSDIELAQQAAKRLISVRSSNFAVTELGIPAPVDPDFRPCAPSSLDPCPSGGAMLLGLSPSLFGWYAHSFLAGRVSESDNDAGRASAALTAQYGPNGHNEEFRTLVQGTTTIIGCASFRTQRVFESLGLGSPPVGGAVGTIDCHIGGSSNCCSESAASVRYVPTASGEFQFSALNDDDVVTMNGQRITPAMGSFPLFNEDICTVGPRVFVFLLPTDT